MPLNARLALATCLFTMLGCGPPRYVPPGLNEPHAQVTLRVLHHDAPGPNMDHETLLNGEAVGLNAPRTPLPGVPLTRAVRVRPGRGEWRFDSRFSHMEQRMRTVYETERYACGTSRVGYGSTSRLETRYCTRQVPRQRLDTVRVPDGSCDAALVLLATAGRRYVLQYDFYAHNQCRARCFAQRGTQGAIELQPCGARRAATSGGAAPPGAVDASTGSAAGQLTSPQP